MLGDESVGVPDRRAPFLVLPSAAVVLLVGSGLPAWVMVPTQDTSLPWGWLVVGLAVSTAFFTYWNRTAARRAARRARSGRRGPAELAAATAASAPAAGNRTEPVGPRRCGAHHA